MNKKRLDFVVASAFRHGFRQRFVSIKSIIINRLSFFYEMKYSIYCEVDIISSVCMYKKQYIHGRNVFICIYGIYPYLFRHFVKIEDFC